MNQSQPQQPATYPPHTRPTSSMMRQAKQVLCIWLPNWPIQRIQAAEPQLANQPLALTARDARRGLVVNAANLPARAAGVRSQMRLAEASSLTELQLRQHEPNEDLEALCSLAEQAQRFSPLVGIEPLDKRVWAGRSLHFPECLLLDVTGLAELFAGYENLMQQAGGWLHQQRYFGCLAIAGSIGAAWALANFAMRGKLEAPLAAVPPTIPAPQPFTAPPDNATAESGDLPIGAANEEENQAQQAVPPVPISRYLLADRGNEFADIEKLPLAAMRIDESTHTTLRRLGLRTIGQLTQLPRDGLASRLGHSLLKRWDQINGQSDEPILALHGSPDWCIEQELEIPTDHTETICELVRRGLDRLASGLDKRGEGALRVVCRLDLVEHVPLVLQLGMFRPTCDSNHLNLLAASLLEQQLPRQMKAPMWRIAVQATLTAPLVWRQGDLFNSSEAANRQEMASLVDMLSARLGRKQVLRARAVRESQPELAFELQPLTGLRPDGHAQDTVRKISSRQATNTIEPAREDPLRRPAQLLHPPMTIEVAGVFNSVPPNDSRGLPTREDQEANHTALVHVTASAPARVRTANGWHTVMGAIGPERLESGWWKGQSSRRDYYRVITHLGCWWWIYRDLNHGKWYLHGIFD